MGAAITSDLDAALRDVSRWSNICLLDCSVAIETLNAMEMENPGEVSQIF